MKTLKQFINTSHIEENLIKAVIKQSGGWEAFKEDAKDITEHGADCGFNGFISYYETVKFTEDNKAAILKMLKELSADIGENYLDVLAGFNCLKMPVENAAEGLYDPDSDDRTQVYNALAWFALEEVARSYYDLKEGK